MQIISWRKAIAALLVLAALLFGGSSWLIAEGVQAVTEAALRAHPGDRVLALVAYVDSPTHTLRERNRAVWALGRVGDPRALPILEKHFTGDTCDHARRLCQYELRKAIELCRGETRDVGR